MSWIHVKERLPEEGVEVLAGAHITCKFADGSEQTNFVQTLMQRVGDKWYDEDGEEDSAVYWHPLPDPPPFTS